MFQRIRESLALVLVALLPFHAFMVTVLTKWIAGPGHAPLGYLAVWKEGVLAVILLMALIEIVFRIQNAAFRMKFDVIDLLIVGLLALGIGVSLVNSQLSILNSQFLYGLRYDFIPLIAFLILRRIQWSEWFMDLLPHVLYYTGFAVVLYSFCSRFFPIEWFTWLGYSDLHSLYVPDGPLAAFQQIGDSTIRRVQGPMSGPNQLGLWLLIPLTIGLARLRGAWGTQARWRFLAYTSGVCLVLLLTLCRAAWIGAAVIIGITLWPVIKSLSRRAVITMLVSAICFLVIAVAAFPSILLRVSSTRGHLDRPLEAIGMMIAHPFGLGLGTAGPATNRTSDSCVMLLPTDDPSWAKPHPNLCVFVGDTQVQPADRVCHCPFLPENWYLQIGVEMGWVGMIIYLALVIIVLCRLWDVRSQKSEVSKKNLFSAYCLLPTFAALSIAALFLHAWEDSAVAYTVWVLIAAALSHHHDE